MKTAIPTEPTRANIAQILDLLAATPLKLESLIQGRTDKQLRQPLGPGERSCTEMLAHLIASEDRSSEAIYLALLRDEPLFPAVHPERQWSRLLRYDLLEFSDLLGYFQVRRAILLRVLGSLREKQWERVIRDEGKQRRESVYWRARSMALHELEHLTDLENKFNLR